MLDILRKGAQSWGIKVVFGIIIAVFVFSFGVSRLQDHSGTAVATVNDAPIQLREFQEAVQRSLEGARQQNPNLTSEILAQMKFKEQVLNQMITAELLNQKAKELGITVSKEELAKEIHQIPAFQNDNHVFDAEKYKSMLSANRLTPGKFETEYKQNLLMGKLQNYLGMTGGVDENQAKDFYTFGRTGAVVSYVMYSWKDYENAITPTEAQISEYYEAHTTEYLIPAQAKIAYLAITPKSLADKGSVQIQEAEKYYSDHRDKYKIEDQVNARHLLVLLNVNATDAEVKKAEQKIAAAQAELKAGKAFKDVAGKYTEDPSGTQTGGALGWFTRGRMVKPFEDAAFNLEPGKVSAPVRTQFGIHLIAVDERKYAGYEEFKNVQAEILDRLAQDRAAETLQDRVDQALEMILSGGDLKTVAQTIGGNLKVEEIGPFSKVDGPSGLELSPENIDQIFMLADNATTQSPINLTNGYAFVTKVQSIPEKTKPLEEVRTGIMAAIKQAEALKLAKDAAESDLQTVAKGGTPAKAKNPTMIETQPFDRQGVIPGLGMNVDLVNAAFSTAAGAWLPASYQVAEGSVIAKMVKTIPPSEETWNKEKDMWLMTLNQRASQQAVQTFLTSLRAKADVRIVNPKALEF